MAVPCQTPVSIVPTVVIPKPSMSDLVWSAVAPSSTLAIVLMFAPVNSSITPAPEVILPKTLLVADTF
mgnify:CR=1 FL=1